MGVVIDQHPPAGALVQFKQLLDVRRVLPGHGDDKGVHAQLLGGLGDVFILRVDLQVADVAANFFRVVVKKADRQVAGVRLAQQVGRQGHAHVAGAHDGDAAFDPPGPVLPPGAQWAKQPPALMGAPPLVQKAHAQGEEQLGGHDRQRVDGGHLPHHHPVGNQVIDQPAQGIRQDEGQVG